MGQPLQNTMIWYSFWRARRTESIGDIVFWFWSLPCFFAHRAPGFLESQHVNRVYKQYSTLVKKHKNAQISSTGFKKKQLINIHLMEFEPEPINYKSVTLATRTWVNPLQNTMIWYSFWSARRTESIGDIIFWFEPLPCFLPWRFL